MRQATRSPDAPGPVIGDRSGLVPHRTHRRKVPLYPDIPIIDASAHRHGGFNKNPMINSAGHGQELEFSRPGFGFLHVFCLHAAHAVDVLACRLYIGVTVCFYTTDVVESIESEQRPRNPCSCTNPVTALRRDATRGRRIGVACDADNRNRVLIFCD